MMVFFRRIPDKTTKSDLNEFIAKAVKGGLFSKSGKITHISIIERINPVLKTKEHHGVITIEPEAVAERVITKMNHKKLNGKYIEVRKYYIRNPANDPRKKRSVLDDEEPDSRRVRDRRQNVGDDFEIKISGMKGFNRKGG